MWKRTLMLATLGLLVGAGGWSFIKKSKDRTPAQAAETKFPPHESAKLLAPLKVAIVPPKQIPEYGDTEITLTGRITLTQPVTGDVSYSWTLPEGVEAVEGEISDSFADVKVNQTVEVELIVIGFTKEKQRLIALQSSVEVGGLEMGGSAVISSRPEDTWESVAPQMQKAAEEHLGTEAFHGRRK